MIIGSTITNLWKGMIMQVQRVQSSYNNYNKRNIYNTSSIGFKGGKQQLISITADSFSSEYTKKLYSKIQKYFKLIGDYFSLSAIMHTSKLQFI